MRPLFYEVYTGRKMLRMQSWFWRLHAKRILLYKDYIYGRFIAEKKKRVIICYITS